MSGIRLIAKPIKVGRELQCHCSDGAVRNIKELAEIVGIKANNIGLRIRTNGWDHPNLLKRPVWVDEDGDGVVPEDKPRRIVQKPYPVRTSIGKQLRILCDNGKAYTVTELAEEINCSQSWLSTRIKRYGWQHPRAINFRKKKNLTGEEWMQQSPHKKFTPGDLAHLSDTHNRDGERVYDHRGVYCYRGAT